MPSVCCFDLSRSASCKLDTALRDADAGLGIAVFARLSRVDQHVAKNSVACRRDAHNDWRMGSVAHVAIEMENLMREDIYQLIA